MHKCKVCHKEKELESFDLRYDGEPLKVCKGCMMSYRVERKKKSYANEVAIMVEKGRQLRKLNDAQVSEIKAKRSDGARTDDLAAEYGVSRATVLKVTTRGYR